MKYGPVDVLVVAMGEPRFDGSVLTELAKLASAGTVRVLDAMVLLMDEDGKPYGVDIEDLPAEDAAALGFIETGTRGLFDAEDAAALTEGMLPGSAILALAIENAWAVPLINSIIDVGAEVAFHTRIPAPIVEDALTAMGAKE
ncbi:MAG TPA: DUF6325 family protein [Coriobacteriia bacterium]|nr:DUF6325 family protein [Coriobacteriia bacterium]